MKVRSRWVVPALIVMLLAAACGDDDDGGVADEPRPVAGVVGATIDTDTPIVGFVVVTGTDARLCSALAESFPPQCGGDRVALAAWDDAFIDSLPGIVSEGDVRWTDEPVEIVGTVAGGVLTVAG